MKCPNKKHPDWIKLVEKLGEDGAYKAYLENNEEIPDPNTVNNSSSKLNNFTISQPNNSKNFNKTEDKTKDFLEANKKQIKLIKDRIKIRENRLPKYEKENPKLYEEVVKEIAVLKNKLNEATTTLNTQILIDLGNEYLDRVDYFLKLVESGRKNLTIENSDDLKFAKDVIDTFTEYRGTSEKALEAKERLLKIMDKLADDFESYYSTDTNTQSLATKEITKDVNKARQYFGALVDVKDRLANTIGSMIKNSQNKISTNKQKLADDIKKEVDKLRAFQTSKGINERNIFDIFIQEYKDTTVLTKPYTTNFYTDLDKAFKEAKNTNNWNKVKSIAYKDNNGDWVPVNKNKYVNNNYELIQKNKELKSFYDFYNNTISEAFNKLPVTKFKDFIPNIRSNSISDILNSDKDILTKFKDSIKNIANINTYDSNYIIDSEIQDDVIPLKYINKLTKEEKSNNLGEALYKFSSFALEHEEMSDLLPKVRIIQETIGKKKYLANNEKTYIPGTDTNIYDMVSKVIDMQVLGKKKLDEIKIPLKNGKHTYLSTIVDFGLKYNSLLRIGFNPFNALTNVLMGELSNSIEAFGGRFYTAKNLTDASIIYTKEREKLENVLRVFNPLQELEDYSHSDQLKFKNSSSKLNTDKIKNSAYSLQRVGEHFLQSRTMIAIMLKQQISDNKGNKVSLWEALDKDGNLKKEFNNFSTEEYKRFIDKTTDKIQRVNQMIHGRYSERDAAIFQQNALGRMLFQFKKWIPSAIEARIGEKQFDKRLGETIEGRYITAWNLLKDALKGDFRLLETNRLSELEIYNMRKNLIEISLIAATILLYYGLKWDDDEERDKNPYYKLTMETLDRVSGDLLFWYSPADVNRTFKNPVPLLKTTGDLIKVLETIPYVIDWEDGRQNFKSGSNKGKNKFYINLAKTIPGINPIQKLVENFSQEKYKEFVPIE